MWLTMVAAGFFAIILLLTLVRAEKSVANGALTVITLLAIGVAVAATIRTFGPDGGGASRDAAPSPQINVALPALSCIDDLAGENVETACEKVLFGSADSTAAAVSYAAGRISRLVAAGDVAAANKSMTPDLDALRRSVERDRFGLMAYVLAARDRCKPSDCAAYASLTDHNQIAANMEERTYDGLVMRYSPAWNAPPPAAATIAALPQSVPTGKPTTADFPSSASIPPINIMTPEPAPGAAARSAPAAANAQSAAPRPAVPATTTTAVATKKPPAPKARAAAPPTAPVQLAPAAASDDN
jgi:hypothetical protein